VAVEAAAVFLILRQVDGWALFQHPWLRNSISKLGRESYNIYLIHPFFIWVFANALLGFTLTHETPDPSMPILGVTLTTVAVLAASLGLTQLLRRIPVVSKLFVLS
jgi:peptidoglycan/LPS O-acetylase OafA/YrhL